MARGTHTQLCLWRGEQVFTHEMLSEGTHDQNVRRLCLQLVDPDDRDAVARVEAIARERLEEMGKQGEFIRPRRRTLVNSRSASDEKLCC